MVKKINSDAIGLKTLLDKGYTQALIYRLLGLKKQKVSYWTNTPIKKEIKRRTKINDEYKKNIVDMAKDKLISDMGARKIADIINKELKENDVRDNKRKILSIEKTAVNRNLKNSLGRPRKVR